MNAPVSQLLGIGVYTLSEAARLTGVPAGTIWRWLNGHGKGNRSYTALWTPQIQLDDKSIFLGFLDLIQVKITNSLIKHGLSPQKIRKAIVLAQDIMKTEHPFAASKFRTDGKTLLLESFNSEEDQRLIDLFRKGQYVLKQIVEPSLKGVEFDDEIAIRWWPNGRTGGVVIDPQRQFGQPIIDAIGVPTRVIYDSFTQGSSIELIACIFRIAPSDATKAIEFELGLAA